MEFEVHMPYTLDYETVNIETLDDLRELQKKYCKDFWNSNMSSFENPPVIVDFIEMRITIYNDYLE